MAWLKLIRWQNLLIIMLTQFLAWWCVILPENKAHGNGAVVLDTVNFLCLSASTILIAAAGYIINDYFDIRIDSINKPQKVVLGRNISPKLAIISHSVLNITALALAGIVAVTAGHPEWLLLQLGCTILLWFYSTHFKRQYITGNIAVALLTALTVLCLVLYEPLMHRSLYASLFAQPGGEYPYAFPVWVLAVYAWFAFMLTWMREIVKDMEDLKGDEAENCVTMPVKLGLDKASRFTLFLSLLVIVPLLAGTVALYAHHYVWFAAYTLFFLSGPLIAWALFLRRGSDTPHYARASLGLKIIMVLGICSLFIYHFQLT